jgi:Family of unknown function (DUF5681)
MIARNRVDHSGSMQAGEEKPGYAVGYGKPPVHARFKKGQSGNPRGTRRARNFATLLIEALDERVVVSGGGRRRRKTKRDLGLAQLADKFANGDPCVAKLILGLLLQTERRLPAEPGERPPREEADKLVVESMLARLRAP